MEGLGPAPIAPPFARAVRRAKTACAMPDGTRTKEGIGTDLSRKNGHMLNSRR